MRNLRSLAVSGRPWRVRNGKFYISHDRAIFSCLPYTHGLRRSALLSMLDGELIGELYFASGHAVGACSSRRRCLAGTR